MARLLVLSLSDVSSDPRVARQVDFLADDNEVVVAAFGSSPRSDVDFVPLAEPVREGPLRTGFRMAVIVVLRLLRRFEIAYWRDRHFPVWRRQLQPIGPDLVLANDAIALPLAFEIAHGAPVVFDAHEYAPTENDELLWWRLLIGPLVRHICQRYLPRVAGMMTVSHGIAELYGQGLAVRPAVVTNAPPYSSLTPRPPGDRLRLIHFGGVDRLRRPEMMIELMALLEDRFTLDLLFVGNPRYVAKLKRLARADPRIRFLDPMPMRELVQYANQSDIGVVVQGGDNPQRRYALPNKFFAYIQARLAVAIGPSPAMAQIVDRYACGIVSPTFEARDLALLLNGLDSEEVSRLKQGSDAAARVLNTEANAPIVREVVQRALAQK